MKPFQIKFFYAMLCTSLMLALVNIQPAYAASIVVKSNADTTGTCSTSGTGICTLRDAITFANSNSGADTITFAGNYTITLGSDLPQITDDLTITGNGVANTIIDGAGNYPFSIDSVTFSLSDVTIQNSGSSTAVSLSGAISIYGTGSTVTITNSAFSHNFGLLASVIYDNGTGATVTVTNSTFSGSILGSGIFNHGTDNTVLINNSTFSSNYAGTGGGITNGDPSNTVTVTNSVFSGNYTGGGGAIWNEGTLTVTNSTFYGNAASTGSISSPGGAIANRGTLTVTSSTFYNNGSQFGGAIANLAGSATITNSTIYFNLATYYGGGIANGGTLTVTNSTLSNNGTFAGTGGGIYNNDSGSGSTTTLNNTIVANSGGGSDCANNSGTFNINHSLIMDGSCGVTNGVNGNLTGDPNLGSLTDNGGPTQTMTLLPGSPAIDAGDDTMCAAAVGSPNYGAGGLDQRGTTRPQGSACDIGAYEVPGGIPLVTSTTPAANATLTSLSTITVTFNQDMKNDGSSKAANYVNNYILVGAGANGKFDTQSCKDGWQSDDVLQTISNASYTNNSSSGPFTATLTLAVPLTAGKYQLFICGSTSIWSVAALELNNGKDDTTLNFTIAPASSTSGAVTLPKTGFTPGMVTTLPVQPLSKQYSSTDLILSIPSLNVKTTIVGVPQTDNTWDVSWLGDNAGWSNGSAFPTWVGNSVITGHVWNADNTPGIFVNLKNLKYGDQIRVLAFGQTYIYEVRESQAVWPSQVNTVMKHEGRAYVTLVTCEDYNLFFTTYSFRRMVRAVLVSIK